MDPRLQFALARAKSQAQLARDLNLPNQNAITSWKKKGVPEWAWAEMETLYGAPPTPHEQADVPDDPSRPLPPGTSALLALDAITVPPDRMRMLQDEVVHEIEKSFTNHGQMHPIVVQPDSSSGYVLIAGRHRLEAARALEWSQISARVVPACSPDEARLIEIDENLVRGELGTAERSAHVNKREEIYARLHPETTLGGAGRGRGKVRQVGEAIDRFTKDTARKVNRSERSVQRDVARGKAIPDIGTLARTSLDKGEELDALVELAKAAPEAAQALKARAIQGEAVSAKTTLKQALRADKERTLGSRIQALPSRRYGVVLADPAWRFEVYSRETGLDRAADNHYRTQSLDEIKALDVASIAAEDCVLFLWATAPMLPHALEVMATWGFEYKTCAVWAKDRTGTGYWFRSQHEQLLVGTRGQVAAPAPGTQPGSVFNAPAGAHSAKPDVFLELIETWYPNTPKIELNRRGPAREGWEAWGLEAESHLEAAE